MYEKQNFQDGQILTADALNKIDEGLVAMQEMILRIAQNAHLKLNEVGLASVGFAVIG